MKRKMKEVLVTLWCYCIEGRNKTLALSYKDVRVVVPRCDSACMLSL
jgi:hypothetical protein